MRSVLQGLAAGALLACASGVEAAEPPSAASTAGAAREALPLRRRDESADASVTTVLLVLGLAVGGGTLVALRCGGWRLPGWRRDGTPRPRIERLSTQVLGRGSALHAVRWHDEELLLGCTDGRVTVLARRANVGGAAE